MFLLLLLLILMMIPSSSLVSSSLTEKADDDRDLWNFVSRTEVFAIHRGTNVLTLEQNSFCIKPTLFIDSYPRQCLSKNRLDHDIKYKILYYG
mmetsp:Transcript_35055/g.39146  ORF Transcript_35055/g.39146 Transcript_35055/m.39146 type:complete len:93 (-) Transcript_35055:22-300(-)